MMTITVGEGDTRTIAKKVNENKDLGISAYAHGGKISSLQEQPVQIKSLSWMKTSLRFLAEQDLPQAEGEEEVGVLQKDGEEVSSKTLRSLLTA